MQYVVLGALVIAAAVLAVDSMRQRAVVRRRPNVLRAVDAALRASPAPAPGFEAALARALDEAEIDDDDQMGGVWAALADGLDPANWRPKVAEGVEIRTFHLRWGDDYALIATPDQLDHYTLELWEAELVPLMDGTRSVDELVVERLTTQGELDAPSVAGLVEMLRICGMLEPRPVNVPRAVKDGLDPASHGRRKLREFGKTLRIGWDGADAFTRRCYDAGLRAAFRPPVVAACAVVAVLGFAALLATVFSHRFVLHLRTAPQETAILLALSFLLTICHELAHALVLVHYRRRVISSGFMIFFGSPAFFVDASDGQMLGRRERILQSFGGPWAELVLAGGACIILFSFPGAFFAPLLYRFALVNYFVIFENLVPLLRLDGYWILCDLIEEPDLRGRSLAFVQRDLWRKIADRQRLTLQDGGMALYGIVGSAYTVFSLWLGLYFWQRLFGGIVQDLWRGGLISQFLLLLLVLVFAGPVIRGGIDAGRALWRRARALLARIRFRLEQSWRVEAAELIDALPGFDGLDEDVLSDLAGRVRLRTLPPGRAVFRQGDRPDAFYVVRAGSLAIEDQDPATGDTRILRTVERGGSFGELGLVDMAPRAATVRAETSVQLFEVGKGTFDHLLSDSLETPDFAPTMQAFAELRALPPYRNLATDRLQYLLEHGSWRTCQAGELIIEQGEPGDAFYSIRSGQADVLQDGQLVATLGAGAHFGELALLNDAPRNATVMARTVLRVFRLDREGFDRIVADDFRRAKPDELRRRDREMEH